MSVASAAEADVIIGASGGRAGIAVVGGDNFTIFAIKPAATPVDFVALTKEGVSVSRCAGIGHEIIRRPFPDITGHILDAVGANGARRTGDSNINRNSTAKASRTISRASTTKVSSQCASGSNTK